jgi:parvulin-like peptidyl-prolyl isomerase
LRLGELSPIIESSSGYHIIRVVAREPAVVKPFDKAQADIKTKIAVQRSDKRFRDYLAKLEARTPVWTVFDKPETADRQTASSRQ